MASNKPAPKAPFATPPVPGSPGGGPTFGHEAPFPPHYAGGPYDAYYSPEGSQHAYAPHVSQPVQAGHTPAAAGPYEAAGPYGGGHGHLNGGQYGRSHYTGTQYSGAQYGPGQYGSGQYGGGPLGDTGAFPAVGDTGSYAAVGDTGSFATVADTGAFTAVGDTAVGGIPVFQQDVPATGGPLDATPLDATPVAHGRAPEMTSSVSRPPAAGQVPLGQSPFGEEAPAVKGPLDGPVNGPWEFAAEEGSATAISPLRGKHRVIKQRSALARSSTVLGVGVIAAVGAGGIAAAQGKAPVSISMPDAIADHIPQRMASLPVVGSLVPDTKPAPQTVLADAPLTTAGVTTADVRHGATDAGEALRARILQQASAQQQAADDAKQAAAEQAAAHAAQAEAAKAQATAQKKADAAKRKAAAEAKKKAEAARLAELAKSYTLPVVSYTITGQFGDPGPMWSSGYHTGLDFAAPTGTPIKAVHGGTVASAGWAGAYGYRTVVKLDDGEELWYCHQSSMLVSVGQKVSTGDVIGRVGATGNVTGPHLHLEVHTTAGTAIDPAPWLEDHGLKP